jgi:hypothetical protein
VYAGALAITTNIAQHRAEPRRIPAHEGEVSAFYDFSGRSSPAAMRDFQRDRKTDGGDPYRPFDIATRAIQLMFPGTKEDTSSCGVRVSARARARAALPWGRRISQDHAAVRS